MMLLSLIVLTFSVANAQKIYLKAFGSYHIGVKSDNYYLWANEAYPRGDSLYVFYNYAAIPYSLGKGVSFGGSIGITLNKYFEFDLAVMYAKSSKQNFQMKTKWDLGSGYYVKNTYDYSLEATRITISPTFQFRLPVGFHYFYSKFGVLFANIKMTENNNYTGINNLPQYYPSDIVERTLEFDKNLSMGFVAGIGFEYYLGENFYAFTDVSYNFLKNVPESSKYTKYNYMGDDQLNTMTISEKEFEYVGSYSETDNINPSKPSKRTFTSYPFDNIAVRLGLKFGLADFSKNEKGK